KYYIRYADDFVILSYDRVYLDELIPKIDLFLKTKLSLSLHESKIIIRKYTQGIDFLGYIILPYVIVPRTKTKRRVFKKLKERIEDLGSGKISEESFHQTLQSYLGYLRHANSYRLAQVLKNQIWFWQDNLRGYRG
ncbi:hypothetical protein HY945_04060, partial [Candidatus Gottesmanbacteria bacterium]|nr:hypothetical protein [Candidatus Gottesmanbacteria bacterium]